MSEPAGLYLHVPYCSAICPYCDFAVRRGNQEQTGGFIDLLIEEVDGLLAGELLPEAAQLAAAVVALTERRFDSIYLGGGTPSLVPAADLERLFDKIRGGFDLAEDTRIFFEANPEDVTEQSVRAWRSLGISTLSLGVQALEEEPLRFLGRGHERNEAMDAVSLAKEAGFETVSIDLIYGLPGQDAASWRRQLDLALQLPIDHLSLYELEIHERTQFGRMQRRGELSPLDEDSRAALFLETHRRLEAAGFSAYEVSNFARAPEHRSRQNRKYWRHVPYLGLGPSAHSLAIDHDAAEERPEFPSRHPSEHQSTWRFWNERSEPAWRRLLSTSVSPAAGWERLPPTALALEAAMLGLRTREGLDLDHVEKLSGIDLLSLNAPLLEAWQERGWLARQGRRLLPSSQGMARADRLASELRISRNRQE